MGYPLQYSWASLVAQLVKNLPAMQETWVRSLHWQDPLEKGSATHSSTLSWRIPQSMGHKESARLSDFHFQYSLKSGSLIPPAVFILKTALTILGLWCFHKNCKFFVCLFVLCL